MLCTSIIRKSQYLKCICQCQRNCNFHWILSNAYPNRRESLASFPFQEKVFKCVRIFPRLITSLLFLQHPKRKVYTNMNIFLYFFCNNQKEKFIQIWTFFFTFSATNKKKSLYKYEHIFLLSLRHTSIKVYTYIKIFC